MGASHSTISDLTPRLSKSVAAFCLLALTTLTSAQTSTITGLVTDTSGKAIAGASVELQPGATTTTAADGKFAFTPLAPATYSVTVSSRGFVPYKETVVLGGESRELKIQLNTVHTSIEVRETVDDFLAASSVSVTKSPQQLIDIPYSIQVIPKALFDSRQIQDIKDLYRNVSGITDGPYSSMTFRGFQQREILFNGVRGNPYGSLDGDVDNAGFSTSQGRLSNIEFVEVLKGTSGVLFGAGEPGGVLNFVTKKPRNEPALELAFRAGSFRQLGGHADVTGPLWKRKNVFYRAAWFQEDRKTYRYNTSNENQHLASGLSWKASDATSLGFEYEYIHQNLPGYRLRGVPVNSSGGWLTNREWTSTEPTDYTGLTARTFQVRLDHSFSPNFRIDSTFRYLNSERPEMYHEPRGLLADGRTMRREFRSQYRANDDRTFVLNGHQRLSLSTLGVHNLVFGVEDFHQDWLWRFGRAASAANGGPVPGIDLFAPRYGFSNGSLYPIAPGAFTLDTIQAHRTGLFIQDQFQLLPRLQILVGGRVERITDDGKDGTLPLKFVNTATTGRIGATYRIWPHVSLFGNLSNSFNRAPPLAQTPSANGPHNPERGRQVEVGFKTELAQGRVLVNAAYYRILKKDVLIPDPNAGPTGENDNAVLPIGKVRNQGMEMDVTGRISRNLSLIANYAFLDSQILEDFTNPATIGGPLPNAARHSGGLFLRYDFAKTGTGLSAGSEMRGRRYQPYAEILSGGYVIWDFGLFQRLRKGLELRVQLDNAFDRLYSTSSLFAARAGNFPGNPRTLTVSLHYKKRPGQ